jgi:hypothetical protein
MGFFRSSKIVPGVSVKIAETDALPVEPQKITPKSFGNRPGAAIPGALFTFAGPAVNAAPVQRQSQMSTFTGSIALLLLAQQMVFLAK